MHRKNPRKKYCTRKNQRKKIVHKEIQEKIVHKIHPRKKNGAQKNR